MNNQPPRNQKTPKKKQSDFWITFAITAGLLILIAVSLRINADRAATVTFTYSTPVTTSSDTTITTCTGSSTHVRFTEGVATPYP